MESLVLFIPFIPLLSAIATIFVDKKMLLPKVSIAFSSLLGLLALYGTWNVLSSDQAIEGKSGLLVYNELAAILVPYVALLGLVIRKYSIKYMWDEPGYKRFFVMLNIIFSAIYLLIMSNHLIILVIAWQLMSIMLYMLVTFNSASSSAVEQSRWTLLIHKAADVLFIIAAILTYKTFNTANLSELGQLWLELSSNNFNTPNIYLIGFLFLFAAMMKSAIIPFHVWLPYTSEAPTPVSALMHAGVVNVGGIMLNKIAFLLLLTPAVLNVAFLMGLITAIWASILMLTTPDIKRSLGYSTAGQMGYMIMEVGIGAFSLAIYHLIVHGIFKATLFLESGSLIHHARHDPNISKRLSYRVFWSEKTHHSGSNAFWLLLLFAITPVLAYIGIKLFISEESFQFNAAMIILAFAWLTGTQLFLSFFKVTKDESFKVIAVMIVSFIIILFTYEFIGHAIERFIYGEFATLFYEAATLEMSYVSSIVLLVVLVGAGWFYTYKKVIRDSCVLPESRSSKWNFYRLLSKESYFYDLYSKYLDPFRK